MELANMNVHIIYLTNKCNLSCPYCYENMKDIKTKDHFSISYKEIDDVIENIIIEEPDLVSTVCLMGGEPLLEIDKIEYIFNRCKEIHDKKQIALNIISNGTLISKNIDSLERMLNDNQVFLSLDISFDASQQYKRTGDSSIVEDNIKMMKERNIPFGISYTISSDNHEKKQILTDLIKILEKFFGYTEHNDKRKIRVNFDWTSLDKFYDDINLLINDLKESSNYLFSKYNVPICELNCESCNKCRKFLFSSKSYSIPGKDRLIEPMVTKNKFSHF